MNARAERRAIVLVMGLLMSSLSTNGLFGQSTGTVRGRVVGSDSTPLASVQITITGTRLGAATTSEGTYVIRGVPAGHQTVRASRIGHSPQNQSVTVRADADATADFKLSESAVTLEQVVTTVTGFERVAELGHAVATLPTVDSLVAKAPVVSVSDVLSTRVTGAYVNYSNGFVGQAPAIVLRGLNSFTVLNIPLMIIDGARVEATSNGQAGAVGAPTTISSRLNDISPEEIESVEIVKGPAAATLYGTDAANGVIVIKTKHGQVGATKWNVYAEDGSIIEDTSRIPTNYWAWGHKPGGALFPECSIQDEAQGICTIDSVSSFNPLKYGPTSPIAPGHHSDVGLQASGGVGSLKYLVSGSYLGEIGFMHMPPLAQTQLMATQGLTSIPSWATSPNQDQKANLRANFSTDLGSKGDVTISNGFIHQYLLGGQTTGPDYEAWRAGLWSTGYNDGVHYGYAFNDTIGQFFQQYNADAVFRYISSIAANYRPAEWLQGRATIGLDYTDDGIDQLQMNGQGPPGTAKTAGGQRVIGANDIAQYSVDLGATATKSLTSSLNFKTSVGGQFNRRTQLFQADTGRGLPPGSATMAGAATISAGETHLESIIVGSFIDEAVGWRDRLFLDAAVRSDGASTFGQNLHTQIYPKYSVSWIASDEPLIPKIPGVSSLRFRAAYGQSGVEPPSTAGITQVGLQTGLFNGQNVSTVVKSSGSAIGNQNVGPERSGEAEAGADVDLWAGRLHTEWTYYSRQSQGALVSVPLPASVGGGSQYENVGSVKNAGLEGTARMRVLDRRNVSFDLTVNGSVDRNKLVKVNPNAPPGFFQNGGFIGYANRVGYPLYGGWQKPILSYTSSNGIVAANQINIGDTLVYLGATAPTQQMAYSGTLSLWRDLLVVTATLDSKNGYVRNDYTTWVGCALIFNCPGAVYPGAATLQQQAAIQGYDVGNTNYGFWSSGAFTRLRELSLTARLPQRVFARTGASGANLVFSGRNLWLWTKWTGIDPEVNTSQSQNYIYTFPTAPQARVFLARLNLTY